MKLRAIVWERNGDGLTKISESAEGFTGVKNDELKAMDFPADKVCPPDFAEALREAYGEGEKPNGRTYKVIFHPLMRTARGEFPIAALVIFMRQPGGEWEKTIGHLFILAPTWYVKLPECCRRVVKRLGLLLLHEAA